MPRIVPCLFVVGATAVAAAHAQPQHPPGTAKVRGTVTAENTGEPIRGASVHVWVVPPGRSDSEGAIHRSTTSDANGAFSISDVPAGSASLGANKDGFYYLSLLDADGPQRRSTRRLKLQDGNTVENVSLVLGRAGAIFGRVTDEHGEPATSVRIEPMRRLPGGERWSNVAARPAQSDDTGVFRLGGLPPGE